MKQESHPSYLLDFPNNHPIYQPLLGSHTATPKTVPLRSITFEVVVPILLRPVSDA
jgi:hypothetical protein